MRGQSGKCSNAGAVSGCAAEQPGSDDIGGNSGPWCEPSSFSLQHKYTSIAEVQVHMEDEYLRSPLSGVSVGWGWDEAPELELWMCGSAWSFSSREGWVCSAGR